ncbi:MAG: OmpA family protein [Pseudomonadota bacterium]
MANSKQIPLQVGKNQIQAQVRGTAGAVQRTPPLLVVRKGVTKKLPVLYYLGIGVAQHPQMPLKYPVKGLQIKELAAAFNQTMPNTIKVHGHTDKQAFKGITSPAENYRLNLKLSQQRAEAVKRELVVRGISKKRIQTQGYGSKEAKEEWKFKNSLCK